MKRSRRFQPVVDDARRREEIAARRLGEARQQLREAELQLQQLESYRAEYARRLTVSGGMGSRQLQDYRCFLERLNQAIVQQRQRLHQLAEMERQCRDEWQARYARHQAIDKVQAGYLREEQHAEARREQKQLDEHALAVTRRRTNRS